MPSQVHMSNQYQIWEYFDNNVSSTFRRGLWAKKLGQDRFRNPAPQNPKVF